MKCPNCNEEVENDSNFCSQCGYKLIDNNKSRFEKDDGNKEYYTGYNYYVEKDYKKAFEYFSISAKKGNIDAQFRLAKLYEKGLGIERDYQKAIKLYTDLAEKGDSSSQLSLGLIYQKGNIIVEKDEKKAFEYLLKAANKGNSEAQWCLGRCYANGIGCEKNEFLAFEWYTKSAEQNNPVGQYFLGLSYQYGIGIEKNYLKAHELYKQSAEKGNEQAKNQLKNLKKRCPNCNEEIDDDSKFCSQCGTKLSLSNQSNNDEFNYRSDFEFEELKNLDDITNLKISLANIEFIFPILMLTLHHMVDWDENWKIAEKNLYKQFIASFIFMFMNSTTFEKDIKKRIYRNTKIDKAIFDRIEYFIPTKKEFLSNSIKLLEDMIILLMVLKTNENSINSEVLKQDYKDAITRILVYYINSDFDDKVYCNTLIKRYKGEVYYNAISILMDFLSNNGTVDFNFR